MRDPLSAARGILYGLVIGGLVLWPIIVIVLTITVL